MTPSDEALLAQYKEGDPRAFRSLVQRYTTPIYGLAMQLLHDPMEAENVAQETFLRVVTSIQRVRVDLPFKPYLFRIAVNLCRDQLRKKRPFVFSDIDETNTFSERGEERESASDAISDDTPPLWERLEKEETLARLRSALASLAPAYQAVVVLRYVEEFSYEEIAQALDLPLNTVRTHLRRARLVLKAKMEKDSGHVQSHGGFAQLKGAQGRA